MSIIGQKNFVPTALIYEVACWIVVIHPAKTKMVLRRVSAEVRFSREA